MLSKLIFMALLAALPFPKSSAEASVEHKEKTQICGEFFIDKEDYLLFFNKLQFSSNEKLLICGGDKPGWKKIPRWQAIGNIKNFLNSRGYNKPVFIEKTNRVFIEKGNRSEIESIEFEGAPKGFSDFKFLGAENRTLSSSNLNMIESWTSSRVKILGYPCPTVQSRADAESGSVTVKIAKNKKIQIKEIERDVEGILRQEALSRFDAFQKNDWYNGENLALTSRRIVNSGIADYSDLSFNCLESNYQKGKMHHRLTFNKPQSIVLAVGGTTEELPLLKLSWRHARLDKNASTLKADFILSPVRQSFSSTGNLYLFNNAPRLYFLSELKIERFSEETVGTLEQRFVNQSFSLGLGYTFDDAYKTLRVETKPTYTIEDQEKGQGFQNIKYLSLESSVGLSSHRYEFNQFSPFTGYELNFDWSFRQQGVGSDFSGNLYSLSGTYLLNWGGHDPPLFVLGFRFGYSSLVTSDLKSAPNKWRLFLGGGDNLRGFARKSINNEASGFRTSSYAGLEIRALKVLPLDLQPFAFLDLGRVGFDSFSFSSGELLSPGLGLRWQSPFGAVRGTVARGVASTSDRSTLDVKEELNFYVSLGREF